MAAFAQYLAPAARRFPDRVKAAKTDAAWVARLAARRCKDTRNNALHAALSAPVVGS
jgi:hypothetical protein